MDVLFDNSDLREECNDSRLLRRRHNVHRAKLIRRRLDDLSAVPSLETMRSLPGRCHELVGKRKLQLSVDLDGPYRLLFRPINEPIPVRAEGGLDWANVTAVSVIGIVDTHD